jgi:hypothetical protein
MRRRRHCAPFDAESGARRTRFRAKTTADGVYTIPYLDPGWPATIPPIRKGLVPAAMSSAARLWKTFRGKPNSIPGPPETCSASARIPVRLQPGILFGINAESCSASPRNRVRLAPDSAPPGTAIHMTTPSRDFSAHVRHCVYREIGYFVGVEFNPASKWSEQSYSPPHAGPGDAPEVEG